MAPKRKADDSQELGSRSKLRKVGDGVAPIAVAVPNVGAVGDEAGGSASVSAQKEQPKKISSERRSNTRPVQEKGNSNKPPYTIRKLNPPRPFPIVPSSMPATAPRSVHVEGKNKFTVTRKTPLGAYLRRCKEFIIQDDYKIIIMHALGAAIPHLLLLASSLPLILPFPPQEIHVDYKTMTVEVTDELVPENEEEDIGYRVRGKSGLRVVLRIGDEPPPDEGKKVSHMKKRRANIRRRKGEAKAQGSAAGGGASAQPSTSAAKQAAGGKAKAKTKTPAGSAGGQVVVFAEGEQSDEEDLMET